MSCRIIQSDFWTFRFKILENFGNREKANSKKIHFQNLHINLHMELQKKKEKCEAWTHMKQPCRRQTSRFHTHSVQQPVLQSRPSWLHFKAYCLLFLWLIFLELRKRKATYNEYYRGFLDRMISKGRVRFRATLQSHNLVFLAIFVIYTMCVLALLRMTNQVRQLPLLICAFHATHPF